MSRLPRLSPSGVSTWTRCQVKWWFDKVAKIRGPQSPAQAMGTGIHARIEEYLLTGSWPAEDELTLRAKTAQRFLTPLREGVLAGRGEVEKLFTQPAANADALQVIEDALLDGNENRALEIANVEGFGLSVYCLADYIEPGLVVDHKSSGDIHAPWHPKPGDLRTNDQMLWYAYFGFRDAPPEEFDVQHNYVQTRNAYDARALRVSTNWQKAMVTAKKFLRISISMRKVSRLLQPDTLRGNLHACGDFGGCPHAAYCPTQLAAAQPGEQQMSNAGFLANVNKLKGGANANVPKSTPEEPAGPAEAGQMNASDSPGTATPTQTQLDEMLAHIIVHFTDSLPSQAELAKWLISPDGKRALNSTGLGASHIPRVLLAWKQANDEEVAVGDDAADNVHELATSPTQTIPDDDPEDDTDVGELDDVDETEVRRHNDDADALNDAEELDTAIGAIDNYAHRDIFTFLQEKGGAVRVDDTELAGLLRLALGVKQLRRDKRTKFLGELADKYNLTDHSATYFFFHGMNPHPIDAAAQPNVLPPEPAAKIPASKATPTVPPHRRSEVATQAGPSHWQATIFLVGALTPTMPCMSLDDLLEPFYREVSANAQDVKGVPTGSWLLDAYAKGPSGVAALVQAAVASGNLQAPGVCVTLVKTHPLAPFVRMMFPQANFVYGV